MIKPRVVFLAVLLTASTTALAGTYVKGYGSTRAGAAANAESKARNLARQKRTCYEYVDDSRCRRSREGGWMCIASVANHQGSCGGYNKVRP